MTLYFMLMFHHFRDSFISMLIKVQVSEKLSNDVSYLNSEEKSTSENSNQKEREKTHSHTDTRTQLN